MPDDSTPIFEAMADPTRRQILTILADGELTASQIAAEIDSVGRTGVSSHLRVLRTSGLVRERREGRYRWYSVNPVAADEVVAFLASVYHSAFADLKKAVEKAKPAPGSARRHASG
jgi:DNA-binding transcriptional ArsR family regulator